MASNDMALNDDYLVYPLRRHGYDHERFEWSMLGERAPITWPGGKTLAVWINISLQFYPLDQRGVPFKVPNGMTMPTRTCATSRCGITATAWVSIAC